MVNQYLVHILSPVTDNCPTWISGRERMATEMVSWPISTKECCRIGGSNPQPPDDQSDMHLTELPGPTAAVLTFIYGLTFICSASYATSIQIQTTFITSLVLTSMAVPIWTCTRQPEQPSHSPVLVPRSRRTWPHPSSLSESGGFPSYQSDC